MDLNGASTNQTEENQAEQSLPGENLQLTSNNVVEPRRSFRSRRKIQKPPTFADEQFQVLQDEKARREEAKRRKQLLEGSSSTQQVELVEEDTKEDDSNNINNNNDDNNNNNNNSELMIMISFQFPLTA